MYDRLYVVLKHSQAQPPQRQQSKSEPFIKHRVDSLSRSRDPFPSCLSTLKVKSCFLSTEGDRSTKSNCDKVVMAWFHQAVQGSSQADASMMSSTLEDPPHTQVSRVNTTTPFGPSDGQVWPTLPPVSIADFPSTSGAIVPQCLKELSCASLNMRANKDPVPLSYVTLQEQRCVLSWFLGWNAAQRERFLEDLISKAVPGKVSSLLDQLNTLQVNDRLPNIFECQLRLWTQWFDSWSEEERNAFLNSLEEKDPVFVAYFYSRVAGTAGRD